MFWVLKGWMQILQRILLNTYGSKYRLHVKQIALTRFCVVKIDWTDWTIKDARCVFWYAYNRSQMLKDVKYTKWIKAAVPHMLK